MNADITPDQNLIDMLVCPITRGSLKYNQEAQELISNKAKLAFPVRDGIPVMITSEARELTEAEIKNIK